MSRESSTKPLGIKINNGSQTSHSRELSSSTNSKVYNSELIRQVIEAAKEPERKLKLIQGFDVLHENDKQRAYERQQASKQMTYRINFHLIAFFAGTGFVALGPIFVPLAGISSVGSALLGIGLFGLIPNFDSNLSRRNSLVAGKFLAFTTTTLILAALGVNHIYRTSNINNASHIAAEESIELSRESKEEKDEREREEKDNDQVDGDARGSSRESEEKKPDDDEEEKKQTISATLNTQSENTPVESAGIINFLLILISLSSYATIKAFLQYTEEELDQNDSDSTITLEKKEIYGKENVASQFIDKSSFGKNSAYQMPSTDVSEEDYQ